jgi:class 3 adenylate cyclase
LPESPTTGRCADLPPEELAELRSWLLSQGATHEQLDAAGDDLDRVVPELALGQDEQLSARDIAERLDAETERIVQVFRAFGVAVPDVDRIRFTEQDASLVSSAEAAGLVDTADGKGLMRVVASSLDRIADAAVAQETARMTMLAGRLGEGMGVLFRHHLRQAIDRQRVSQEGVASPDLARMAIGFVDLVGSTARTAALDVGTLREVVNQFEARAWEVAAEYGGRVVKFIGDEIMVATVDPMSGCRLLLALIEACSVGDMQPRGGMSYGEVIFRGGDYYGREVNLASRLVDAAIPGEVLVDAAVFDAVKASADAAADGLAFDPAGRRVLKGFADPLPVWSVDLP